MREGGEGEMRGKQQQQQQQPKDSLEGQTKLFPFIKGRVYPELEFDSPGLPPECWWGLFKQTTEGERNLSSESRGRDGPIDVGTLVYQVHVEILGLR